MAQSVVHLSIVPAGDYCTDETGKRCIFFETGGYCMLYNFWLPVTRDIHGFAKISKCKKNWQNGAYLAAN